MPSTVIDVPGLEVGRTRASMTRGKRGSGKLNNTDDNAQSRYKRPRIPETTRVVTEQMMEAERARLLGEKQAQLTKVTKRHDTLVCFNSVSSSFVHQFFHV
jgi:hypothetical protein